MNKLDKAKLITANQSCIKKKHIKRTDDEIELAIAWLRGEISLHALRFVQITSKEQNRYSLAWVAVTLAQAVKNGKLKVL